jgi:hypothetical protein
MLFGQFYFLIRISKSSAVEKIEKKNIQKIKLGKIEMKKKLSRKQNKNENYCCLIKGFIDSHSLSQA